MTLLIPNGGALNVLLGCCDGWISESEITSIGMEDLLDTLHGRLVVTSKMEAVCYLEPDGRAADGRDIVGCEVREIPV